MHGCRGRRAERWVGQAEEMMCGSAGALDKMRIGWTPFDRLRAGFRFAQSDLAGLAQRGISHSGNCRQARLDV